MPGQHHPRLAAHLSVFGEDIALTESLGWLRQMHVDKLEGRSDGLFLNAIRSFINQPGFLPHNAQLKSITSRDVEFVDGNGCELSVENLSDGYRATLSMTFELIRQLANGYGIENLFDAEKRTVVTPGVVLVDEIDAHLHPNWQTRIGKWFEEYFGEIQFIVTTHSPIICWAAEGGGTVYKLPLPGSRKDGAMVEGIALLRLLYGDLLDAYGTDLFGQDVTRSEKAREKLQELADLNFKEKKGSLNKEEKARQYELRSVFSYE